jgi:hypothetical protein
VWNQTYGFEIGESHVYLMICWWNAKSCYQDGSTLWSVVERNMTCFRNHKEQKESGDLCQTSRSCYGEMVRCLASNHTWPTHSQTHFKGFWAYQSSCCQCVQVRFFLSNIFFSFLQIPVQFTPPIHRYKQQFTPPIHRYKQKHYVVIPGYDMVQYIFICPGHFWRFVPTNVDYM